MKLPRIRYTGEATRQQEVAFGGLNRTDAARAGELTECENLSARRHPLLAQRKGRNVTEIYENGTAAFSWDDKLVVVDNNILYYEGEKKDNVSPGEKQFAVVNTKLCIWPDKTYIDLTNGEYGHLDAEVEATGVSGSVTVTDSSLRADLNPKIKKDIWAGRWKGSPSSFNPMVCTYGTNQNAIKACWTGKEWNLEELPEEFSGILGGTPYGADRVLSVNDIFIPQKSDDAYTMLTWNSKQEANRSQYNNKGYYGIVTKREGYYGNPGDISVYFDVYKADVETKAFSGVFKVGDAVTISGTLYGIADAERAIITEIDEETNTLRFAAGTLRMASMVFTVISALTAGTEYYIRIESGAAALSKFRGFTPDRNVPAGSLLYLNGAKDQVIWWASNTETGIGGTELASWNAAQPSSYYVEVRILSFKAYDTSGETVTIQRPVPELDYICESGNRLWGVSNSGGTRTIYASALGDPTAFWTFEGVSTDSWQLAVGTDGDFTAICAYDNGVCCWKENLLHKILGSYPAEYYEVRQELPGVQKGSWKSAVNVEGTLLYKGVEGVYAYRGAAATRISGALGEHRYHSAVAGSIGPRYYISMTEGEEQHLLVYDLTNGLWMREDGLKALDFCTAGGTLYLLADSGALLELETDRNVDMPPTPGASGRPISWSAVFAPFGERDAHERKNYLRLLLRLEIGQGGSVTVWVQRDGTWQELRTVSTEGNSTVVVPVWPGRIDDLRVKLTGTAPCAVLSIAREYTGGSIFAEEAF